MHMFMYLALLFMEPADRLVKEAKEKNKVDWTEIWKQGLSIVCRCQLSVASWQGISPGGRRLAEGEVRMWRTLAARIPISQLEKSTSLTASSSCLSFCSCPKLGLLIEYKFVGARNFGRSCCSRLFAFAQWGRTWDFFFSFSVQMVQLF